MVHVEKIDGNCDLIRLAFFCRRIMAVTVVYSASDKASRPSGKAVSPNNSPNGRGSDDEARLQLLLLP